MATSTPVTPAIAAPASQLAKHIPQGWSSLGTPRSELRLDFTLPTGQSFRWKEIGNAGEYLGVVGTRAIILRQLEDDVAYKVLARADGIDSSPDADFQALSDYFNLPVSLSTLAKDWCVADPYFARLNVKLQGARMLRQDPLECLFSFICSQNNHISRIHGMVTKLCNAYGTVLPLPADDKDLSFLPTQLHAFPTLEQLSKATEEELRDAGFGYRAKYIVGAVEELRNKPEGGVAWLMALRNVSFDAAVQELCTLPGVGPKVAACAALFSLDKHSSVPVDVHVFQLAIRHYTPHLRGKTNTPKLHPEIQAAFIKIFGQYAGWAHNTLFIAELPSVKARLKAAAAGGEFEDGDGFASDSESSGTSSEDEGDAAVDEFVPVELASKGNRKGKKNGLEVVEIETPALPVGGKTKRRRTEPERYGKFVDAESIKDE